MTKVIMNVSIAGVDFSYYPGQEVELDDKLAKTWDKIGHCTIIKEPKKAGGKGDNNIK